MHQTTAGERGETIFQMIGPHEKEKYDQSVIHTVNDEDCGFFRLTEEE
jgi:hypothetical protein